MMWRMRWRALLIAILLIVPAHASVSFTVLLDALASESSAAVVMTPFDQKSVWEDGRIATYTHVRVERVVAGTIASDVWIKTLGGAVGDIGQMVEGEAVLRAGQTSLLFITSYENNLVVAGRGQGQFPITADGAGVKRVHKNLHVGALLAPNPSSLARIRAATSHPSAAAPAGDVLDGRTVDDAATEIASSWTRTHVAH